MSPYPHVRVSGAPRERGRQYGEAAAERVARSVDAYRGVFEHYADWDWSRVRAMASGYVGAIRAFSPTCLEEIAGIAEGAGIDELDVLAINVRTEVMFAAVARDARAELPHECSSFAVLPSASRTGTTLLGQNWDWLLHTFDTVVVLESEREDGPSFVTVVEAGLLAKSGLNAAGIGLTANALVTFDDVGRPAVPFHVLLRELLDAEHLPAALATLQRAERSSSANYLLGHAGGTAVDVEAAPGDFTRLFLLFPDERGLLLHTNHFLHPGLPITDVSPKFMPDSPFRLDRLRRLLAPSLPLAVEDLQRALGDHAEHPLGICCHPDLSLPAPEQSASAASLLMDLEARTLWLADGNPCSTPFRELDYAELLAPRMAVESR